MKLILMHFVDLSGDVHRIRSEEKKSFKIKLIGNLGAILSKHLALYVKLATPTRGMVNKETWGIFILVCRTQNAQQRCFNVLTALEKCSQSTCEGFF